MKGQKQSQCLATHSAAHTQTHIHTHTHMHAEFHLGMWFPCRRSSTSVSPGSMASWTALLLQIRCCINMRGSLGTACILCGSGLETSGRSTRCPSGELLWSMPRCQHWFLLAASCLDVPCKRKLLAVDMRTDVTSCNRWHGSGSVVPPVT